MLGVYFAVAGPRVAYTLAGFLGRLLYRLLPPLRTRSEAQLRAVWPRLPGEQVTRVAEQAFVHRVWNLTDLLLAERLLHPGTYELYGGRIPEPHRGDMRAAQQRRKPTILLSAYYGPFDLLPVFLGYNGIRASVVYRSHLNVAYDEQRRKVRARSGCDMVPVERAGALLPQVLEAGGTIAIVADHHADRRGLPVTFLGLPTMAMRSVGLLASRYDADVVVAGIRRVRKAFRFEIIVEDVIRPDAWTGCDDPIRYITERYLRGLERLIQRDPTQYLWAYARWGEDVARRLTVESAPAPSSGQPSR